MNFLMRSGTSQSVAVEQPSARESPAVTRHRAPRPPSAPLEALIAEDPYPSRHTGVGGGGGENGDDFAAERNADRDSSGAAEERATAKHSDVSDDRGWITIPYKELPDDWSSAPDIESLRRLDRSFVFPGEQVHILACLSACTEEAEVITPFKVAAAMSKNGFGKTPEKENGKMEDEEGDSSPRDSDPDKEKIEPKKDVTNGELRFRMEDHKRKTEMLLQRFEKSHYFVRISESGEPLWSKKGDPNPSADSEGDGDKSIPDGTRKTAKDTSQINAVIDKGSFDPTLTGGAARNTVKCCSLANGDLVVLLQVNVGVEFLNVPVIEILQFEKYNERSLTSENQSNVAFADQDPCGELLRWLLPLDNTLPTLDHPVTPPINSSSGFGSTSQKPSLTASSSSQLFSFGNFRSYSMSSLPQNNAPALVAAKAISSKPSYDLEDWEQYSSQKLWKSKKTGSEGLLSFRGVSLERERFSVCCGLEGIYMPGRRWRRKLEIIQPVEIRSFAADCNTDDLLCVQIKNTSPAHTPDIEVYIDAITIVIEKASKGGQPISLPIACTEAGIDHSLPNLFLRRGEEHSFILKPATSLLKNIKGNSEKSTLSSQVPPANAASSLQMPSKTAEETSVSTVGQYAIMVSCRCNYTESRLFFKQPTSWRPRISRNLMISVASEISVQHGPTEGVYQLPVQVLNLQATNLTSEDLTLTVLAPASFTSLPSVVSLNSSPSSPMSPFVAFPEFTEKVSGEKHSSTVQRHSSAPVASGNQKQNANIGALSVSFSEQAPLKSDVIPSCGLGCTHLWLQSRVPLGCVPSQSSATIKLELLPLTDGIITLDTLQIDVKEKGLTYIPEHSLKINATSSISTAIV